MKIKTLIIWNIVLTILLIITGYGVGGLRVAFPLMTDRLLHDEKLIVEQFEDFQNQLNEQAEIIQEQTEFINRQASLNDTQTDKINEIIDSLNRERK